MANAEDRPVHQVEILIGVGLFLLTVVSRIPFRSQILYHWDSVNFAFAMQRFDVAAHQPQLPGYIAYVWLCRAVDLLFRDPQVSMVSIAVISSGLGVVAIYLLGRAMFNRRVGVTGAFLLASSPLYWFYGGVALPHALDLFLITLSAWLLYEAAQGRGLHLSAAALVLATAGGVRQQTPVFLGLLLLVTLVSFFRRVGWTSGLHWALLSVVLAGLVSVSWFLPLIRSVGGLDRYLRLMGVFSAHFHSTTSLLMGAGRFGLARNMRKLGSYTLYGWGAAVLPVALHGLMHLRPEELRVDWERPLFLLLWVLPALAFYTVIHMGQQGLVFVFLPVLLVISARSLVLLTERRGHAALAAAVALLSLANATVFVTLPDTPFRGERAVILNWYHLARNDAYYRNRFGAVREHLPAESTVILASSWRHVDWYLTEYHWIPFTLGAKWEIDEGQPLPSDLGPATFSAADLGWSGEMTVVLFDRDLEPFNHAPERTFALVLADGVSMSYLRLQPGEVLQVGPSGITVRY